ncbi:hypothetical protein D0Y65_047016 [Glycine soja]|uniref:Uncharacterized protein n=1 Tax=Glycine soja TaxID=3848 RepID=A0A445GBY8_GLYSO|nr:hypothetical protein D0Y65_047016 [Glycine soja]
MVPSFIILFPLSLHNYNNNLFVPIFLFSILKFVFLFSAFADPIHSVAEQAGQDPSCQILRSSRGLREAQGRIRGSSARRKQRP